MYRNQPHTNINLFWIAMGLALTEMGSGSLSYAYSFLDPNGRYLTDDEITLAQRVYGESIDYKAVRVLERKSFTTPYFEWQKGLKFSGTANRNLIYLHDINQDDVKLNVLENFKGYPNRELVVHELGHVAQVQKNIPNNGDYETLSLTFESGKAFTSYAFEQQPGLGEAYYRAITNIDQLSHYFRAAGAPTEQVIPKMGEACHQAEIYRAVLQPVFGTKPHPACLTPPFTGI